MADRKMNEYVVYARNTESGCKFPSAMTDVGMVQFTTTMAYDNLK